MQAKRLPEGPATATWRRLAASGANASCTPTVLRVAFSVRHPQCCCRAFMLATGAAGAARTLVRGPPRRALTLVARGTVHSPGGYRSTRTTLERPSSMEVLQNPPELVPQAEAAWEWFNEMGAPKFWVSACQLAHWRGAAEAADGFATRCFTCWLCTRQFGQQAVVPSCRLKPRCNLGSITGVQQPCPEVCRGRATPTHPLCRPLPAP